MANPALIASGVAAGANVLGGLFSGLGANARADAIKSAARKGKKRVKKFVDQFSGESSELRGVKQDILESSSNVFDRLGGFVFGDDTTTVEDLRSAQQDFAALAAGDTSGFQREFESSVRGALADTFGSPVGAFENLSARNLMDFRSRGLQNATSLSGFFGGLGEGLINMEFGVMDQDFDRRLGLGEFRTNALNQLDALSAGQEGAGLGVVGSTLQGVAGGAGLIGSVLQMNQLLDPFNTRNAGRAIIIDESTGQVIPEGDLSLPTGVPTDVATNVPTNVPVAPPSAGGPFNFPPLGDIARAAFPLTSAALGGLGRIPGLIAGLRGPGFSGVPQPPMPPIETLTDASAIRSDAVNTLNPLLPPKSGTQVIHLDDFTPSIYDQLAESSLGLSSLLPPSGLIRFDPFNQTTVSPQPRSSRARPTVEDAPATPLPTGGLIDFLFRR